MNEFNDHLEIQINGKIIVGGNFPNALSLEQREFIHRMGMLIMSGLQTGRAGEIGESMQGMLSKELGILFEGEEGSEEGD